MSDLGDFAKKAEQMGKEHAQDVDKGVEEAEKVAGERTGHEYDDQIKQGGDQVEKRLGGGQDQLQDQQDQQDQRGQQADENQQQGQ
ncbi:MAG TPA: antitoxin [Actinospica sp.]|nr:antitoxin [Actinospica sp.]